MAVTKKAVEEAIQQSTQTITLEDRVQTYGEIQDEIEKLDAQIASKTKALREKVSARYDTLATLREEIEKEATRGLPDNQKTSVMGATFEATIGKCKMSRTIKDMPKVAELVGQKNFVELVTFPLGKIDDYLNPEERALVLDVTDDGPRSFKVKSRKA